jgi:hypothetical protein
VEKAAIREPLVFLRKSLAIKHYNRKRLHQTLGYQTSDEVYDGRKVLTINDRIVVQNQGFTSKLFFGSSTIL